MKAMNVMSIDVEDWFCVQNMARLIDRASWDSLESRVEKNTLALLDLFAKHRTEATFFVLGWVAERFPDLVREIARRGHEIASHGYSHRLLTELTPQEFEADLARSLEVLARCVSAPVDGFRAPSFSVTRQTWWAFETLSRHGIKYDSSVFPIGFHPDYGIGDAPLTPHIADHGILEIPMSCAQIGGRRIPCSGGGYFRLIPYPFFERLIRACNSQGRPVIFYLHPWEIDPDQPRVSGLPWSKAVRHYRNLDQTLPRLERLLETHRFTSLRAYTGSLPSLC